MSMTVAGGTPLSASGGRVELSNRQHLVTVILSTWLMIGLFVDGWAHNNAPQLETFFTPWHALFYSGFIATAAWIGFQILRLQPGGRRFDRSLVPAGYGLGAIGVILFAAGGVADMIWHVVFGVEVGLDALLSPTHLLLFTGGILVLTSTWRAGWVSVVPAAISFRNFFPVALSITLTTALLSFIFMYLSPFTDPTPLAGYNRYINRLDNNVFEYRAYSHIVGIAGVLITNVLMVTPVLIALRRWRLPFGVATLSFTVTAALMLANHEFGRPETLLTGLLGGLAADLMIRSFRPTPARPGAYRAVAAAIPAAMWTIHFGVIASFYGLGWAAEFWTGTIFFAALSGLAVSLLLLPPQVPASAWSEAA